VGQIEQESGFLRCQLRALTGLASMIQMAPALVLRPFSLWWLSNMAVKCSQNDHKLPKPLDFAGVPDGI
jgi:hypothetical protein